MTILQHDLVPASAATGYQISRSLRFNSADSAYLARTPASAGNRQKFTVNVWVKRSALGSIQRIISCTNAANGQLLLAFTASDTINFQFFNGSVKTGELITTPVYRDVSGWYNILFAVDTTQATASNRVKLYVNGTQVTAFSTATYMAQNEQSSFNNTVQHTISSSTGTSEFFSGYLAEITFVDGQQLDPTSFGEFDANTGVWVPKAYTGTYGTNGFWLKLDDNSGVTATTLGKDSSGNGNNWTPNNFSVTAGAGNDSLVDSPTNYGTDTGAGGEVRGNYCTWNPLNGNATPTNGNLDSVGAGSASTGATFQGTFGMTSGKWYWEVVYSVCNQATIVGVRDRAFAANDTGIYTYYASTGNKVSGSGSAAYGASWTTNDVIGVAYDADAGSLTFYKNNVSQGVAYTGLSGTLFPYTRLDSGNTASTNFGQRPFAYTAPSGFKALCSTNLPTPAIGASASTLANKYFDTNIYTGNGTSSNTISSANLKPDFLWVKNRSAAASHILVDAVRGINNVLVSSSTSADQNLPAYITSLTSNGFTVGTSATDLNANTNSYVYWAWNAGGSTVTNTNGTISSQVRANAAAGISVVTYTGNGTTGATVGHGLGIIPAFIIIKKRSATGNWQCWHKTFSGTQYISLNLTTGVSTLSSVYNATPTSSVFQIGNDTDVNASGATYVAYCFAEVAGFSKFGSYTGNGSADGPFVYCGFRPRFVLMKRTDSATFNWVIFDTARNNSNLANNALFPNISNAEDTTGTLDILSNGFKWRGTGTTVNASGGTYIFAAFAEAPFNYARAR